MAANCSNSQVANRHLRPHVRCCSLLESIPHFRRDRMSLSPASQPKTAGTATPAPITVTLTINGETRKLAVAPWTTLLDLLRERLDLTGTKKGCDHGQCGACTVLVEGRRVNSCLTLAVMKDGAAITT